MILFFWKLAANPLNHEPYGRVFCLLAGRPPTAFSDLRVQAKSKASRHIQPTKTSPPCAASPSLLRDQPPPRDRTVLTKSRINNLFPETQHSSNIKVLRFAPPPHDSSFRGFLALEMLKQADGDYVTEALRTPRFSRHGKLDGAGTAQRFFLIHAPNKNSA